MSTCYGKQSSQDARSATLITPCAILTWGYKKRLRFARGVRMLPFVPYYQRVRYVHRIRPKYHRARAGFRLAPRLDQTLEEYLSILHPLGFTADIKLTKNGTKTAPAQKMREIQSKNAKFITSPR